jgi:hypothetical protein
MERLGGGNLAYFRTDWKDRLVQFPNRFKDEDDNIKTFTPSPGIVTEEGTYITASKMKSIHDGIEQNNLFNLLLTPDKYKLTEFNIDGSITESIKLKSDDSVYATITTEFDTPTAGSITASLVCSDLGISNKVVTVFNVDGSITETSSEVV